jgi:hypothetical protein
VCERERLINLSDLSVFFLFKNTSTQNTHARKKKCSEEEEVKEEEIEDVSLTRVPRAEARGRVVVQEPISLSLSLSLSHISYIIITYRLFCWRSRTNF